MDEQRLKYLLKRHLANTITEIELDELFELLDSTDKSVQERIIRTYFSEERKLKYTLSKDRKDVLYQKLEKAIGEENVVEDHRPTIQRRKLSILRYAAVAAAVLITLSSIFLLSKYPKFGNALDTESVLTNVAPVDDIYLHNDSLPHIRLTNGDIQVLDTANANQLSDLGVEIKTGENGEMLYKVQSTSDAVRQMKNESIVFSTPKGQSSKVILIDGTVVWLNSSSSLEYPTAFSSKERRVKVEGEAYFDVAHNKQKPFYVETKLGPTIKVLGTEFNLTAYEGEREVTTTLVEGSVQFQGNSQTVLMKPNDQVVANQMSGNVSKQQVNVNDYISWKEGYFNFNQQSIEQILATVQRWYNVEEVQFGYRSAEKFSGTFKRTKSLKSLLTKLEKISNAKFKIEEGRIIVTK